MKYIGFKSSVIVLATGCLFACSDFEELNKDPNAADRETISVEGLLNSSISDAQLSYWNRDILFHRTWSWGSRFLYRPVSGPQVLQDSNDYMTDYWKALAKWIFDASEAVNIGEERMAAGTAETSTNNYVQMARIWRAHLFSEAADMFGPYPAIEGFKGEVAPYNSVEEVYEYIDKELQHAVASLDEKTQINNDAYDTFFAGKILAWKKYGNSLRLRCAMRFSRVGNVGKERFEKALVEAGGIDALLINTVDIASVAQAPITTTDPAGSVFDVDYIDMSLTATITNLTFGIGGVKLEDIAKVEGTSAYELSAQVIQEHSISPNEYLGNYMPNDLPTHTNVETAGYLFDYIPSEIDPRTLAVFHIPGYNKLSFYPDQTYQIEYPANSGKFMDVQYSFSSVSCGDNTGRTDLIQRGFRENLGRMPSINTKYRRGDLRRVFFGSWETYFLLAEAAQYGWDTGRTAKEWYELGVKASFAYHGLLPFAEAYLESEAYNRIGTSAKFSHSTEIQSVQLKRKLYDQNGKEESVTYNYPKGLSATNNDPLSKIMTQKYIAQVPWQPLEATNDYRRTGLPFIENPYLQGALTFMPFYTDYKKADIRNIYRRVRYPFSLKTKNPEGYDQALQLLGGPDKPETPFIWQMP